MSTDFGLYAASMTLLQARAKFFERSALGPDGGYQARWVRVEAKPFPFYFPNTRSRVAAAKLHDLHHVATGYRSDWPGEAEIAAWELAAGCGRYGWAWLLNLGAFFVGVFLFPKQVWQAFVRGRRAQTLYRSGLPDGQLSHVTVGALRSHLAISALTPSAGLLDRVAFACWVGLAVAYHAAMLAAAIVSLVWFLRVLG